MSIYKSNTRERIPFTQPKMPSVASNTFGLIKSENYEISKYSNRYKATSEHISDQLCKMPHLLKKSKFSRNNSQSYLSDYTSSTSSSVKLPKQITNPSPECIPSIQHHNQPKIHLAGKVHRIDSYCDSVETSSLQSQNQGY